MATNTSPALGTSTPWHTVVLWGLGFILIIALADPMPQAMTWLVLLLVFGTLVKNANTYMGYLKP